MKRFKTKPNTTVILLNKVTESTTDIFTEQGTQVINLLSEVNEQQAEQLLVRHPHSGMFKCMHPKREYCFSAKEALFSYIKNLFEIPEERYKNYLLIKKQLE